jgi:hypothetical protein
MYGKDADSAWTKQDSCTLPDFLVKIAETVGLRYLVVLRTSRKAVGIAWDNTQQDIGGRHMHVAQLSKTQSYANPKKSQFLKKYIAHLGHRVSATRIEND